MLILEIKICQQEIEKEIYKDDSYKRKKILNHLINCVDKLQKKIFALINIFSYIMKAFCDF